MDTNYSLSDMAALMGNKGFGNGDGLGWLILIFLVLGWGGGYGNRGAAPAPTPMVPPNVATQTDVQNAINNQTVNNGLNNIALSSANNNYETAQLVNGQTNALMQQNYANQINAIQGFNNISQAMTAGFNATNNQILQQTNQISAQLSQLGYQMENCCCSIKTQMLQDRLDDRNRQIVELQNDLSNMRQTQTLLGTSGRYVAWAGSGTQASSTVTA